MDNNKSQIEQSRVNDTVNSQHVSPYKNKPTMPTKDNMELFGLWQAGHAIEDIAKLKDISIHTVNYHIQTVKRYYKEHWQEDQYQLLQSKLAENNRLINAANKLIDNGDSKTVNNLINRTIIPKDTTNKRQINVNFIANRINLGKFAGQDGPDIADIVDADYSVDDDNQDDT